MIKDDCVCDSVGKESIPDIQAKWLNVKFQTFHS